MRCALLLAVALSAVSALARPASAQIVLPPTIDDTTFGPLLSGNVYIAPQNVTVPPGTTQTIQPDVVVKFEQNTEFIILGTLLAQGTGGQPIFLTSLRDDSVGGQTDPLAPAEGDWRGVRFRIGSPANELLTTIVRFAGRGSGSVELEGSVTLTMQDCVVELSLSAGVASSTSSTFPVISDCDFRDNLGRALTGFSLPAVAGLSGNIASNNAQGNSVFVTDGDTSSSLTLGPDNTIGGVLVLEDDLLVNSGDTLELLAGLIVKMGPRGPTKTEVRVIGTLITSGATLDPVAFTSIFDDNLGGDSLGDGPTTGTPGDWRTMTLTGSSVGSSLNETLIHYAGLGTAAVVSQTNNASLHAVRVAFSSSDGLSASDGIVVTESSFEQNAGQPISPVDWFTLRNFRDNTAQGNTGGDSTEALGGFFSSGNSGVNFWNTLNSTGVIVVDRRTSLGSNAFLTLGPGLIIKFSNPADSGFSAGSGFLQFDGRGYRKIVLTSFFDDEFGGDTNGDGNATFGQPGDWRDVEIPNNSQNSQMNFVYLRFAGRGGTPGLTCSGLTSLDQIRVDQSAGHGMVINKSGGGQRNLVAFVNQGDGIVLRGAQGLLHATVAANIGRGIVRDSDEEFSLKGCISWFNADGGPAGNNIVNFDEIRIFNCNGSPIHAGVDDNFVADPLFADPDNADLTLNLFSPCIGTAGEPNGAFTYLDMDGNSRVLDHNLFGFALPDMGAYEYFSYETQISGQPRIGKTLTLRVEGQEIQGNPDGVCLLFYGLLGYNGVGLFLPPFGNMLINQQSFPLLLTSFPTQFDLPLTIPDRPDFVGLPLNLQPLVLSLVNGLPGGNWATPHLGNVQQ